MKIWRLDHQDLFVDFIYTCDKMAVGNILFFLDRRSLGCFHKASSSVVDRLGSVWLKMLMQVNQSLQQTDTLEVTTWSMTIPLSHVFWQYMNETNEFVDMRPAYSSKHEEHLRHGNLNFEYDVPYGGGTKTCHYEVNLSNMTQSNTKTGSLRNLRRLVVCNP